MSIRTLLTLFLGLGLPASSVGQTPLAADPLLRTVDLNVSESEEVRASRTGRR